MVNFISKSLQNTLQLSRKKVLLLVTGIRKVDITYCVLSSIIRDLLLYATPIEGWKLAKDMTPLLADSIFDESGQ